MLDHLKNLTLLKNGETIDGLSFNTEALIENSEKSEIITRSPKSKLKKINKSKIC